MAGSAVNAYCRGDFRRGRDLSREAIQGVGTSPRPSAVLATHFTFLDPKNLAAQLTVALQILDETAAETHEYAEVHGSAAAMAAVVGNVDLAQQEAAIALEMGRRIGNPSLLSLGRYALALSSWQSDPTAAQTALEESIEIGRSVGDNFILARVLALVAQLRACGGDLSAAAGALRQGVHNAHINGDRPAMGVCLARGAVVMAALREPETAAVFWGAVANGVFARLTILPPNEITGQVEIMTTVRSQLGDGGYIAATDRGAAMTYEQVTAFALAAVEDPQRS
jgi:hypothetical protein